MNHLIDRVVRSCIHLVRTEADSWSFNALGSGCIVQYRGRYFLCTAGHFAHKDSYNISISTGFIEDNKSEGILVGNFGHVIQFVLDVELDAEDIEYVLSNPAKSGTKVDIAFTEIPELENILQKEITYKNGDSEPIVIEAGAKGYVVLDDEEYVIDTSLTCGFSGRIRPDYIQTDAVSGSGILDFQETLYGGLGIKSVSEQFIEIDLRRPIRDHNRFRGCSGAPIFDNNGRLIALLIYGDEDTRSSSIFGYRIDMLRRWIYMRYFRPYEADKAS